MRVRCIHPGHELNITLNKVYDVIEEQDTFYKITSDTGARQCYLKFRFEEVKSEPLVSILHPYTILIWDKKLGFRPIQAFSLPEYVYYYCTEHMDDERIMYVFTPAGCMFTRNFILTLGKKEWIKINQDWRAENTIN